MSYAQPAEVDRQSIGHWLHGWWIEQLFQEHARLYPEDPGIPAWPWLPDGRPFEFAVSFVAAARDKRYPVLFNLDELRRNVRAAQAGVPDLRNETQRRRDAWKQFQAAKEKYEKSTDGSTNDEEGRAREADGHVEEATGKAEG